MNKGLTIHRRPLLFAEFLSTNSLIHLLKLIKNDNFLVINGLFSVNSRFADQNDETYLPQIMMETCTQRFN